MCTFHNEYMKIIICNNEIVILSDLTISFKYMVKATTNMLLTIGLHFVVYIDCIESLSQSI